MNATEFFNQDEPMPYYLITQGERTLLNKMVIRRMKEYHAHKLKELEGKLPEAYSYMMPNEYEHGMEAGFNDAIEQVKALLNED